MLLLLLLVLLLLLQLLQFLTVLLEKEAERLLGDNAAENGVHTPRKQQQQQSVPGPTEMAVRLALQLVQLHFR